MTLPPPDEASLWIDGPLRSTWEAGKPPESAAVQERQMARRAAFMLGDEHRLDEPREGVSVVGGPLDNIVLAPRLRTCGCAAWPAAFRQADGATYRLSYVQVNEDDA